LPPIEGDTLTYRSTTSQTVPSVTSSSQLRTRYATAVQADGSFKREDLFNNGQLRSARTFNAQGLATSQQSGQTVCNYNPALTITPPIGTQPGQSYSQSYVISCSTSGGVPNAYTVQVSGTLDGIEAVSTLLGTVQAWKYTSRYV
jgi:hypothetical protein